MLNEIILQNLGSIHSGLSTRKSTLENVTMFDQPHSNNHQVTHQKPPHLRPDLMRLEHVDRLRRRDAEKRAAVWKDTWQGIADLVERFCRHLQNAVSGWAEEYKLKLFPHQSDH